MSPDRPIGMGSVGAIPTTAILAMAEVVGEDPWVFLVLCRTLDGVYSEHVNRRKPTENAPPPKPQK